MLEMNLSIVIPAYNEERLLPTTLELVRVAAQAAFTTRGWEWEIVVCDNNSSDRTAEIAREAGAKVIFEPVNQIGRARDTGARAALGQWLIFIDADSPPSTGLFADIAEQIVGGRALGGGVTVRLDSDAPWHARLLGFCWNSWSRLVRWAAGSCVWVEVSAFREVGGFGIEAYAGEEVGLSRKLKRLARQRHLHFVILSKHPLDTSSRKVRLYTPWEMVRLLLRMVFSFGRAAKDPKACHLWYDGRR
jgi:glycosyltransferase involved in cell wall biosynthesis